MSEHDTNDGCTDADERSTDRTDRADSAGDEEVRSWTESSGTGTVNVQDLTKVYGTDGDELVAVDEIDLHIEAEEFVTVLGPSGCGKSTVMECVAGYLNPTEGEVLVNGKPVDGPDPSRGVVFQENLCSIADNVDCMCILSIIDIFSKAALVEFDETRWL